MWPGAMIVRIEHQGKVGTRSYIFNDVAVNWTSFGISVRGRRAPMLVGVCRKGNGGGNPGGNFIGKGFGGKGGVLVAGKAGSIPAALNLSNRDCGSGTAATGVGVGTCAGGGWYCVAGGGSYCDCGEPTGRACCVGGVEICGVADDRERSAANAPGPNSELKDGCCAGGCDAITGTGGNTGVGGA